MKFDLRVGTKKALERISKTQTLGIISIGPRMITTVTGPRVLIEHPKNADLTFLEQRLVILTVNLRGIRLKNRVHQIGLVYKIVGKRMMLPIAPTDANVGDLVHIGNDRIPSVHYDEINTFYPQQEWIDTLNEFTFEQSLTYKDHVFNVKRKGHFETERIRLLH